MACTWLQADPVEPQFPFWYTGGDIAPHSTIYCNPKQRSRAPHLPQAPTTVTHCFFEVLPLNEPQICRTGNTVSIFLHIMLAYVEIRLLGIPKGSSSMRQTRAIVSRLTLAPVGERYITPRCSHLASNVSRCKTFRK